MTRRWTIILAAVVVAGVAALFAFPDRTAALARPHAALDGDETAIYAAALRTFVTSGHDGTFYVVASIAGTPIGPAARRLLGLPRRHH